MAQAIQHPVSQKRSATSGASPISRKSFGRSFTPTQPGRKSRPFRNISNELSQAEAVPIVADSSPEQLRVVSPLTLPNRVALERRLLLTDPNKIRSKSRVSDRPGSDMKAAYERLIRDFEQSYKPKAEQAERAEAEAKAASDDTMTLRTRINSPKARQQRVQEKDYKKRGDKRVAKLIRPDLLEISERQFKQDLRSNLSGNKVPMLLDINGDIAQKAIRTTVNKVRSWKLKHPSRTFDFSKNRNRVLGNIGELFFKAHMEFTKAEESGPVLAAEPEAAATAAAAVAALAAVGAAAKPKPKILVQQRTYIDTNDIINNFHGIDGICERSLYSVKTYTGPSAFSHYTRDLSNRQEFIRKTNNCFTAALSHAATSAKLTAIRAHLPENFSEDMRYKIDANFLFVGLDNHVDALPEESKHHFVKMGCNEVQMLGMLDQVKTQLKIEGLIPS